MAMAKDLIGKDVTLVSQLWDTAAASWHQVTVFFPVANQRISTAYNRLLSQLKPPSSYLLAPAHFSAFEFNSRHYVQDYSDPSWPSFFLVEPHHQCLLRPTSDLSPSPQAPRPTLISQHRATLIKTPQLHNYSLVPHIFYRLSKATLLSGILLHCAGSADFRKLTTSNLALLAHRLEKWSPTPGFNAYDNSRWLQIWGFNRALNEASFLWKVLFQADSTQRLWHPTTQTSDPLLSCALCVAPAVEDEAHLLCSCLFSQRLWTWCFHIFKLRSGTTW
jgi:hypothetical protein